MGVRTSCTELAIGMFAKGQKAFPGAFADVMRSCQLAAGVQLSTVPVVGFLREAPRLRGQDHTFFRVNWNMEFDVILESRTGRNHCTADL
jgi:hypothetical protein